MIKATLAMHCRTVVRRISPAILLLAGVVATAQIAEKGETRVYHPTLPTYKLSRKDRDDVLRAARETFKTPGKQDSALRELLDKAAENYMQMRRAIKDYVIVRTDRLKGATAGGKFTPEDLSKTEYLCADGNLYYRFLPPSTMLDPNHVPPGHLNDPEEMSAYSQGYERFRQGNSEPVKAAHGKNCASPFQVASLYDLEREDLREILKNYLVYESNEEVLEGSPVYRVQLVPNPELQEREFAVWSQFDYWLTLWVGRQDTEIHRMALTVVAGASAMRQASHVYEYKLLGNVWMPSKFTVHEEWCCDVAFIDITESSRKTRRYDISKFDEETLFDYSKFRVNSKILPDTSSEAPPRVPY